MTPYTLVWSRGWWSAEFVQNGREVSLVLGRTKSDALRREKQYRAMGLLSCV